MKDRPGLEDGFRRSEDRLNPPQFAVGERHGQHGHAAVGAQHMQSVELRIIGDTRGIDLKMPLSRGGEEAAIAGIADQLLIAAFQFAAQAGDDGVTRSGVTACLGGIETDHVATRLYPRPPVAGDHLLDLDVDLAAPRARNGQRHHRRAIGQYDLAYFGRAALAGTEDVIDTAGLEFGDRLGTDHAAIGDHAHVADAEAIAQPGETGSNDLTSVALPGQVSEQIGRPASSSTTLTTT